MSDKLVAQVQEAFVVGRDGTAEAKRVLLILADMAADDGSIEVPDDGRDGLAGLADMIDEHEARERRQ